MEQLKSINFLKQWFFDFMKTRYFSWCQQGLAWKGLVKITLFSKSEDRANIVLKTDFWGFEATFFLDIRD